MTYLVERGANPNCSDAGGTSPLMTAAVRGEPEMLRVLLTGGAEVDARDAWGRTALWFAANRSRATACKVLLEAGAQPTDGTWTILGH